MRHRMCSETGAFLCGSEHGAKLARLQIRSLAEGQSWKYVARQPGEHAYLCTFHPNMKATLRVA